MIKSTVLKNNLNKLIKTIMFSVLVFCLLIPSISYANEAAEYQKEELVNINLLSNTEVMTGLSNYGGPTDLDISKYNKIGIDKLYGLLPKQTKYYGEVPRLSIKDEDGKSGEITTGEITSNSGHTKEQLENIFNNKQDTEAVEFNNNSGIYSSITGKNDEETKEMRKQKYDEKIAEYLNEYNNGLKEIEEKTNGLENVQLDNSSSKNFENKAYSKISYYAGAGYRSYTSDKPSGGQGIFKYIIYEDGDENGPYKDLHLYGITRQNNMFDEALRQIGNLLPTFIGALYGVFGGVTSFMIWVCNCDIGTIANSLVDGLKDSMTKMFLINDGALSPLLMVAVVIFIVGIITLIVKRFLAGEGSAQAIVQEFGFLILSAALVAVSLGGGIDTLQQKIIELGDGLVKAVSAGEQSDDPLALYQYSSDNSNKDLIDTQVALSNKPYIDTMIVSQFGQDINALDITEENFGGEANDIANDIVKNGEVLTVKNGPNETGVRNLGYYWYCADSTVNVNEPFDKELGVINHATPKNTVFVIDFLAAINASDATDAAIRAKTQEIVEKFNEPSIDSLRLFLASILQLLNALASGCIAIFTIIAKLIFYVGLLAIPIFPILLLIPQTRTKAKDLLIVWLVSALKMVIGMLLLTLMLSFSAILCSEGDIIGVLVAIAFTFGMFVLAPNIFMQLNNVFSQYEGKFGLTRAANNMTGRAFSKVSQFRRGRVDGAYKGLKDLKGRAAAKAKLESDQDKLDDDLEKAYTNINNEDSDILQEFTGYGVEDGFLASDIQYQSDRMRLAAEAEQACDTVKNNYIENFNEMRNQFSNKDADKAIKEIYNYQHISDLVARGKTNSKEYKDLVRSQLAIERGVSARKISDEDISNFKLDSNKEKYYKLFDHMTKEDMNNELAAIKSQSSIKGIIGKGSDYDSKFLGKKAELKVAQNAKTELAKKQDEVKQEYKKKAIEAKKKAIERAAAAESEVTSQQSTQQQTQQSTATNYRQSSSSSISTGDIKIRQSK